MRKAFVACLCMCLLLGYISNSCKAELGDVICDLMKPNHSLGDRFGRAVAAMGNNVLVSAPFDDTAEQEAGAVYLYDGYNGNLLQTYYNPTPTGASEYFGQSVAAAGSEYVLVGDPDDSSMVELGGSVHMFDAATGSLVRTFHNPTPQISQNMDSDGFGRSVSYTGENILIGAWLDRNEVAGAYGTAYLYDADSGDMLHTFVNPEPDIGDWYGFTVATVGNNIVIADPGADHPTSGHQFSGAVYMYDSETFELKHTWINPNPSNNGNFGFSLAAFGDNVLIGGGRRAYLYDSQTGELLLEMGAEEECGGLIAKGMVSALGDNILVGALNDHGEGNSVGRAYIFDGETGELLKTIVNPSPAEYEYFGVGVAGLANGNFVVSADYDDTFGIHSGKAYLFEGVPEPMTLLYFLSTGLIISRKRRRCR